MFRHVFKQMQTSTLFVNLLPRATRESTKYKQHVNMFGSVALFKNTAQAVWFSEMSQECAKSNMLVIVARQRLVERMVLPARSW